VKDFLLNRLQLSDLIRHLLLGGGELFHSLSYRSETERRRLELLQIGRRGGGRSRRDHVGSGLRNSWRCQPAKLGRRVRDHLSGCIAVGLPNQSGRNTNEKYDQEAHKPREARLSRDGFSILRSVGRILAWIGGLAGHRFSGNSDSVELSA